MKFRDLQRYGKMNHEWKPRGLRYVISTEHSSLFGISSWEA